LLLFSCGGLESKVEDLAEKKCECRSLEEREKRDECTKEYDEMTKKYYEARDGADLKQYEIDELKTIFVDKLHECECREYGGGSIESDAKKVAELECKYKELQQKAAGGDISAFTESTKLYTEIAALKECLEDKYTSDSDNEEFIKAISNAKGNCK
jgi:uncharacterized coiled-coil DUF342 family protein